MPRRIGELRRLNAEWNDLVQVARERGLRRVHLQELNRWIRVTPRQHFQISRTEARDRVRSLRASVAPFFAPTGQVVDLGSDDTFGVEIEMMMPQGTADYQIARGMTERGIRCQSESYGHATRTYWKIVTDGSLTDYARGREVVSPPLRGESGLEEVRRVTAILTELGCKVNLKCGLHVHIGAQNHQDINWFKGIVRMYHHFGDAIDSFMAPSRRGRGAHWCQPLTINWAAFDSAQSLNALSEAVGQPQRYGARSAYRYRKVNLLSFLQCGTVEFRQHQGTVETRKTEMWIRMLLRISAKAVAVTKEEILAQQPSLENFLEFLGCDAAEKSYFTERRQYFTAAA